MRKLAIVILLCSVSFLVKSQEKIDEKDGIIFTATLTKIKEDNNNVFYSAQIRAINTNDYDAFYQGPKNKINPFFATIREINSSTDLYLEGTSSRLQVGDIPLYYIKAKGSLSTAKEFKIKKDRNPVFRLHFSTSLVRITDFK